jgi:hypothetical protein
MARIRYVDVDAPAAAPVRPKLTPALVDKIARVTENAPPVKHAAPNKPEPVKHPENVPAPASSMASVRSSPEAFRAYHRASMAKRRAAARAAVER